MYAIMIIPNSIHFLYVKRGPQRNLGTKDLGLGFGISDFRFRD